MYNNMKLSSCKYSFTLRDIKNKKRIYTHTHILLNRHYILFNGALPFENVLQYITSAH